LERHGATGEIAARARLLTALDAKLLAVDVGRPVKVSDFDAEAKQAGGPAVIALAKQHDALRA